LTTSPITSKCNQDEANLSVDFSLAADQQQRSVRAILCLLGAPSSATMHHSSVKSLDLRISEMLYNSPSAVWLDHSLKMEQIAWRKGSHDMRAESNQCNQQVARTANGTSCNRDAGRSNTIKYHQVWQLLGQERGRGELRSCSSWQRALT
jgi:hypothetical protein